MSATLDVHVDAHEGNGAPSVVVQCFAWSHERERQAFGTEDVRSLIRLSLSVYEAERLVQELQAAIVVASGLKKSSEAR